MMHGITDEMIDNETLTLMDEPQEEKYVDSYSSIVSAYEVITTFMKIHNISATWTSWTSYEISFDSEYQLEVGGWWCGEGFETFECCPPM